MNLRQIPKNIILVSIVLALIILGVLRFGKSETIAAATPELPRVYIDSTYPTLSSSRTVRLVKASCTGVSNCTTSLQTAIDQAALGDEIVIDAGLVTVGPVTLKNKTTGSGWIIIRTSNLSSLPLAGNRVNPGLASSMPKIVSPGNNVYALYSEPGAHHYRFVGVEFYKQATTAVSTLIYLGDALTSVSQVPHDIIFDRVYAHGPPDTTLRRCMGLNTGAVAVIDSYLSECHEAGKDSQAIASWNGPGPFKIVNNYLEGAGENILFGGTDPAITNLVASDIEIRNNYFYKPLRWKIGDPSYAGIHWTIKNLFELKNARRVLIDGNIFENSWTDAQTGIAVLFKSANQDGACTWCVTEDVTFTNNIIKNVEQGMTANAAETGKTGLPLPIKANTILIKNNLFLNISARLFLIAGGVSDVSMDHNTAVTGTTIMLGTDTAVQNPNFSFTNNIMRRASYGIGTGGNEGTPTLATKFSPYIFSKNLLVNASTDSSNAALVGRYPSGTLVDLLNGVGFADAAGGNFQLTSGIYKNAGTDGKDLGVDFVSLNAATANTISGSANSSFVPPPPPVPSDTTKPVVASFTISPVTVLTSATINPAYTVTDSGGSFIKTTELWRATGNSTNCTDSIKSGCFWLQRQTKTAPGSSNSWSSNFTDTFAAAGTYYYGMHVNDGAGNVGVEQALVKVTVQDSTTAVPLDGDLNLDHIVNAIDYSILNSKWFTTDSLADLNHDGMVNAIDYSILNKNWFKTW